VPPRSVWFAAISVIICSAWLTACAPGILGSKDSKEKGAGDAGTIDQARLSKPTTPADRDSGSLAQKDDGRTPGTASGKSPDTFATPAKGAKAEIPATKRASDGRSGPGNDIPDTGDDKRPGSLSSSEAVKRGVSTRTALGDAHVDSATSGKSISDSSTNDDLPFKRHDHKKYVQMIKNKAKDKLNSEKDVTYARVCRDSTTDEWSLWFYKHEGKAYRFFAYAWDEVDGAWKESLPPDKLPSAAWKHHLKFTSDGKQCEDLKGKPY
jgi:hypothetical protein